MHANMFRLCTASSLNCTTHTQSYLLFISEAILLNDHEQDVSIVSGLFECVCAFRVHVPVFILVPLQEHEVDPKLKKMCVSVPWWLIRTRPYLALNSNTFMCVCVFTRNDMCTWVFFPSAGLCSSLQHRGWQGTLQWYSWGTVIHQATHVWTLGEYLSSMQFTMTKRISYL